MYQPLARYSNRTQQRNGTTAKCVRLNVSTRIKMGVSTTESIRRRRELQALPVQRRMNTVLIMRTQQHFNARRANGLANAQLHVHERASTLNQQAIFGASVCLRLVVNESLHPSHLTVHQDHTMVRWSSGSGGRRTVVREKCRIAAREG
jgi:hypothetical protein